MKITGDATCPGCNKDHPVSIDIDKLEVKSVALEPSVLKNATTAAVQQLELPQIEQPKPIIKTPGYIPKFKCKNCNDNHPNKDYNLRMKYKCEKCGQFSPDGKSCLFCENKDDFEELDDDDLDDMGIPRPEEKLHEHGE